MTGRPERTALYRIFGDADLLLYIGISKDFGARWKNEARDFPWWDEHRRMTVEWRDSRPEAEAAEIAAIKAEKPKYNKLHAIPTPPEPLPPVQPAAEHKPRPRRVTDWAAVFEKEPPLPLGARRYVSMQLTLNEMALFLNPDCLDPYVPEENRAYVRARVEEWRFHVRACWNLRRQLSEIDGLEAREGMEHLGPRIRALRASLFRTAGVDCFRCDGKPPAARICRYCGARGEAAVLSEAAA